MRRAVTHKLIASHVVAGEMNPGREVGLRIDQTLTQDIAGPIVMLALDALQVEAARTEVSVQYVDHDLLQIDQCAADDHLFLLAACQRFGVWFSRPGNGVSHALHQDRFGKPGKSLLGSDSHTPAAGAIGMLAFGAGALDVAACMAGEAFHLTMPEVVGIELVGRLPPWVSAKDLALELLRRHGAGGLGGRVLEYFGSGIAGLSATDRHVVAAMGTELGALTSVFPSDGTVRRFLRAQGREQDWVELSADDGAEYADHELVDLSRLEPLIAMPSSPGNVLPVREVAGHEIGQCYVGSCGNPSYRDLAVVAQIIAGEQVQERVSLDVSPASRQVLLNLMHDGHMSRLVEAGARVHQPGCGGCAGMGQAAAGGKLSLRTVPRNSPGRSGPAADRVALVSPETAAASALTGVITDPRELPIGYPLVRDPDTPLLSLEMFVPPHAAATARGGAIGRTASDAGLELAVPPLDTLIVHVLLKVGDDVSTDDVMPLGARVAGSRSDIYALRRHLFDRIDSGYLRRAEEIRPSGEHAIVAGRSYGHGASHEQAALGLRSLGLRLLLARSFAPIHRRALINCGVLPLVIGVEAYGALATGDRLRIRGLREQLAHDDSMRLDDLVRSRSIIARHGLSPRERDILLAGGLIAHVRGGRSPSVGSAARPR